jgi:pyruvate formate lyase activating enzyme
VIFLNTPWTLQGQRAGAGSRTWRSPRATLTPRRARSFTASWTPTNLKAFTEEFYKRLCAGHLSIVLATLEYLKYRTKVWFEITTLLIPGHNDSLEEVKKLGEWVMTRLGPDVPLHFTAFHPDYKMLDLPPYTGPHADDGSRYRARGRAAFCLRRNVHNEMGESAYCPGCGERVIGRDWNDITT